jgi:hypothetical protein
MLQKPGRFALGLMASLALAGACGAAAAAPSCPAVGFTQVEQAPSRDTRPLKAGEQTIFVRRHAITETSDISEIKLESEADDAVILVKFKPAGTARLHDATTDHSGARFAFVADDEVVMAFTWTGPYGMDSDGSQLTIPHGLARARVLVAAVRRCIGASAGPRTP